MDITSTETKQCPRCHAFELILDPRSHRDNDVEWCLVCGFLRDDRDGDIPLPHHSLQYSMDEVSAENLLDTLAPDASAGVEDLHGELPVYDLAEAEAWLKARESEDYVFAKCVIVNEHGHVIWLRGNPSNWNWDGNN